MICPVIGTFAAELYEGVGPVDPSISMTDAALAGMRHVLDLTPDDTVLVVSDTVTIRCAQAFLVAAAQHGCEVTHYRLPEADRPLQKMPADMKHLPGPATVVVNAITGDEREIPFRLAWLFKLEATPGLRLGHSPGITEEMLEAGPLNVDYAAMQRRAAVLHAGFRDAAAAHITTPGGTDLRLDLRGRRLVDDLKAVPGTGTNLPCGEVYCCPVEDGASGTLVVDGCYGTRGVVPDPVHFTVRDGQVVAVESDSLPTRDHIRELMDADDGARTIAELGIGLNEGARLSDNILEAEKALSTAHLAFGSNQGMPGGRNTSATHIDYLIHRPTIAVEAEDGTLRTVLRDGMVEGYSPEA